MASIPQVNKVPAKKPMEKRTFTGPAVPPENNVEMKPVDNFPVPNSNLEEENVEQFQLDDEVQPEQLIDDENEAINAHDYDKQKYGNMDNYFPNEEKVNEMEEEVLSNDTIGKAPFVFKSPQTKSSTGSANSKQCSHGHPIKGKAKTYLCNESTPFGKGCDRILCASCISNGICSCGAIIIITIKNKAFVDTTTVRLEKTHSLSRHMLAAIPKEALDKVRGKYLDTQLAKYKLYISAIQKKKETIDLSCPSDFSLMEKQHDKELKTVTDSFNFKNIKINAPCTIADCNGNLMCKDGKYSCDKCSLPYCFGCRYPLHEGSGCGLRRGLTCRGCQTVTVANGKYLYCIGCFSFYDNGKTLPGLSFLSAEDSDFPDRKPGQETSSMMKDFMLNRIENKTTLYLYITLYNKMIEHKNENLFRFFVDNVLCKYSGYEEADAEIIKSVLSVSDRNAYNKVEELKHFIINGINFTDEEFTMHRARINKMFKGVGNNTKDLISPDLKIRAPSKPVAQ
jgi:hypothetical protein